MNVKNFCLLKNCRHGAFLQVAVRILLGITIVCVFIPLSPLMPMEGLDNSWMFGINQAVGQKLAFGRDIIFTFGPYASVYTKEYHPATDFLMLLGSSCLAISYCVGTFFLIGKEQWGVGIALAAVLAGIMLSRDALLFSYALIVGLSVYKLIMLVKNEQYSNKLSKLIMVGLFFCFGLPPLIKGSMLILYGAISLICAFFLCLKKERGLAFIALTLPAVGAVVFWLISGQSLHDLPAYISAMVPIASGYTEAMSIPGNSSQVIFYISGCAVLCLVLYFERINTPGVENTFLLLIYFVFLFLAFKGGFVRHDGHARMAGISILIASVFYLAVTSGRRKYLVAASSFCVWLYIYNQPITAAYQASLKHALEVYKQPFNGLVSRLQDSEWLGKRFIEATQQIREASHLPIMQGTSDIYSSSQSSLIASGNTWNARPVFQSYSAYTPLLAEKNRDHLLQKSAPDNIVFSIEPIDGRLPSIEDGMSWPALLSQYHPTLLKDKRLFLRRNSNASSYIAPKTFLSKVHELGETIQLPVDIGAPIFVELDIKPTFAGSVANVLFKSGTLNITLNMIDGTEKKFRIIPNLSKSGFLLSPFVEYTSDFGLLYGNKSFLQSKIVKSFSISAEDSDIASWQDKYSAVFKTLENKEPLDLSSVYSLAAVKDVDLDYVLASDGECKGAIDVINGIASRPSVEITGLLKVDGWLAISESSEAISTRTFLAIRDRGGRLKLFETRTTERPDVAAAYHAPELVSSGYTSTADVSSLDGDYSLGLAFQRNEQTKVCPQFSNFVTFNNRSPHAYK